MVVGEFTQEVDLAVIGGGPGGYAAAFRAAELGVETVIIDPRDSLGGICLHEGCVPSKTLLHIAETIQNGERAQQFGVTYGPPKIDRAAIRAWLDKARTTLSKGLAAQAKKLNVEHLQGEANFEDTRRVNVVGGSVPRVRFRRALIATGSRPIEHPALPFDGERVLTPGRALDIESIPENLLVIGGGYMAIEMSLIYRALGSKVTLVHEGNAWLPSVDADLTRNVTRQLAKDLEHTALETTVESAEAKGKRIHITFAGKNAPKTTEFDRVIVAIGQRANTDKLNLDRTGVTLDEDGFIRVDDQLRTTDPRLYAVGDVTGGPLLADFALAQGRVAAESIAGWKSALDVRAVPVTIFTDPQIAWCGLTESQAKAEGVNHDIVKLPWGASGRAVGMGRTDGLTKIIYDPDTKIILGVGLVGTSAAEMIGEGALAVEMGAELDDLAGTLHPHPTMNELIADAARQVADRENGKSGGR
ncbi:MAG: dihydrolipoyl dehydrogenase [Phycisphaerales bacterium]|nr:MAG: dihydrolipoyl dehydrogenase [Phycisphaerales bacterium]